MAYCRLAKEGNWLVSEWCHGRRIVVLEGKARVAFSRIVHQHVNVERRKVASRQANANRSPDDLQIPVPVPEAEGSLPTSESQARTRY